MLVNADLSLAATVDARKMDWVDSPLPGVRRKMLDRDGDELARATSLVQYAPDSKFKPHEHDRGEEFLVLDGVFSDQLGDYPSGCYVRNPPGSRHAPFSRSGCVILVKLRQMADDDDRRVVIDTQNAPFDPPSPDGTQRLLLHAHDSERVWFLRLTAGASLAADTAGEGRELFILDGTIEDQRGQHAGGTWLRYPPGMWRGAKSLAASNIWLKTGHLPVHAKAAN